MKKNYFQLGSKSVKNFFFLGSVCALTAFTPVKNGVNPPSMASNQAFFDVEDYVQFTVSGFNEDVIINGIGDFNLSTTNDVDGTGFCFLEVGTQASESGSPTGYGLPADGILSSGSVEDLNFQLAAYDANNALRIADVGETGAASLTFAETGSYETLFLAVTGGGGATTFSGTIDFEDGSTQAFASLVAEDWYQYGDIIVQSLGRGNRNNNSLENFSNGPKIFQLDVAIDAANQTKTVTGITIQKDAGGFLNLFAVSGKLAADCQSPSDFATDAVNAFDATISWTGYGDGETFEVALVAAGAGEPTQGIVVTEESYTFSELSPETSYDVYVRMVCTVSGYSYWVGPLSFTTTPSCVVPEELSISAVQPTSATVNWTAGSESQTDFEVAVLLAGSEAPESGEAVAGTSYELSALELNTSYEVYVRANCGEVNGFSEWVSVGFTTPCEAVDAIDEGFEAYANGNSVDCWGTINVAGSGSWQVYDYNTMAHSGEKSIRLYATNAQQDYLIAPPLNVVAHENDVFSFYIRKNSTYYTASFDILVSTTGTAASDFTDTVALNVNLGTSYEFTEVDLSAYDGQTVYVAIVGNTQSYGGIYVDDVLTSGSDYCDAPTDLNIESIAPTSAVLTWEGEEDLTWEVAVQEAGAGEPTEAGVSVAETSYEASYSAGSVSEFYVRTQCADGENYSQWAGPFVFGGYQPLEVTTGLNFDVIANGTGNAVASTNNTVDTGDWAFVSEDFKVTESSVELGFGLPANGVFNSAATSGLIFNINDYSENNVLRMQNTGTENGGTLTFTNALPAETLYFAITAGSAAADLTGTITFTDGSTQVIETATIPDWYNSDSLPIAISGIGRINTTNNTTENPSGNPRIYELSITIAEGNQSKTIASVTLQKDTADGAISVFAVSAKFSAAAASVAGVDQALIKAYPNPVQNKLTISGVAVDAVEVYNIMGQLMNVGVADNVIDMSTLKTGVYLVTIHSKNTVQTIRIIKK